MTLRESDRRQAITPLPLCSGVAGGYAMAIGW
jgi:hypothetical protein